MNRDPAILQRVPTFAGLTEETLEFLLDQAREVVVEPGQPFFLQGEPGTTVFVLEEGHVDVRKRFDGGDMTLRMLGPGDCFGEMAVISIMPRSASAFSVGRSTAVSISNGDIARLYERNPAQFAMLIMNLAREVCRRFADADERLFALSQIQRPSGGE
ncbi:MAG: cyclic nucleotide-binding domain-containing protein [Deltaproteobacteria bacterium]|nr:cyclic nucleotide-binding domain-containing protein [Deltaproteobacteria bacterium]